MDALDTYRPDPKERHNRRLKMAHRYKSVVQQWADTRGWEFSIPDKKVGNHWLFRKKVNNVKYVVEWFPTKAKVRYQIKELPNRAHNYLEFLEIMEIIDRGILNE